MADCKLFPMVTLFEESEIISSAVLLFLISFEQDKKNINNSERIILYLDLCIKFIYGSEQSLM